MANNRRDPDDFGFEISLLLFALVALVAWLVVAACAETAQTVIP